MFVFFSSYTFFTDIKKYDFNYNIISRNSMDVGHIILGIFISTLELFTPLVIMIINLKTVNFKKYLFNLMKGYGNEHYFVHSSYFLYVIDKTMSYSLLFSSTHTQVLNVPLTQNNRVSVQSTSMMYEEDIDEEYDVVDDTEIQHVDSYQVKSQGY